MLTFVLLNPEIPGSKKNTFSGKGPDSISVQPVYIPVVPWTLMPACAREHQSKGNPCVRDTWSRQPKDAEQGGGDQNEHCHSVSSPSYLFLACSSFRMLHYKNKYLEAQHEMCHLSGVRDSYHSPRGGCWNRNFLWQISWSGLSSSFSSREQYLMH